MKIIRPTKEEIEAGNRQAGKVASVIAATLIPPPVRLLSKIVGPAIATRTKQLSDSIRFTKGMTTSGISSAFKKAGSIGNVKKPDTVGNRIKQAQAIMGLDKKTISLLSGDKVRTFKGQDYFFERGARLAQGPAGIFTIGKTARTVKKAVEQGPVKFFSSGRNAKTGITPNKRLPGGAQGGTSKGSQMKYDYDTRVDPKDVFGTDVSMSVYHNKNLIKEVLKQNKKAREALKKK